MATTDAINRIDAAIDEAASTPKSVQNPALGSVTERGLAELDDHRDRMAATQAVRKKRRGLVISRISGPPSC